METSTLARRPQDPPSEHGPAETADGARGRLLEVVFFPRLTDTRPRRSLTAWERLATILTTHHERRHKGGWLWSPTVYAADATRGNGGVLALTALPLDFDGVEPPWPLLEGWEYAAHTTQSHAPAGPRWRVVLPLAWPVAAAAWPAIWARARRFLAPGVDEACKDAARCYYLPSCRPGAPRESRRRSGRWIDPADLPQPPEAEASGRAQRGAPGPREDAGCRPGDDFNARGDWRAVLEPHGWRLVAERGGEGYWCRPGKARGVSATTGYAGGASLYVFSSNAPPFAPGASYSKFAAYALLEHGGDFAGAAGALSGRGYGRPVVGELLRGADGVPVRRLPRVAARRGAALPAVGPTPGISLSGLLAPTASRGSR